MKRLDHTPGPWEFTVFAPHTEDAGHPASVCSPDDDECNICDLEQFPCAREEQLANARLIAAAPRMYAELWRLYEDCGVTDDPGDRITQERIGKLLAEIAEGGE